jgi:hypothetical protein
VLIVRVIFCVIFLTYWYDIELVPLFSGNIHSFIDVAVPAFAVVASFSPVCSLQDKHLFLKKKKSLSHGVGVDFVIIVVLTL